MQKSTSIERVVQKFSSFSEAENAEYDYLSSLTPQQRLDALLELLYWAHKDAPSRLERVCRITDLASS